MIKAVVGLAVISAISGLLGVVIGFVCRGRAALEFITSVVVSAAFLILGAWMAGTLSTQWSWQHPVSSVAYLLGPYVLFWLLPTSAMAALIGNRYRKKAE
jgi:hypothetical protein